MIVISNNVLSGQNYNKHPIKYIYILYRYIYVWHLSVTIYKHASDGNITFSLTYAYTFA